MAVGFINSAIDALSNRFDNPKIRNYHPIHD